MNYEVRALKDINQRIGDRVFNNKVGESLELSSAGVEIALHESMDGAYELVRTIPETDFEIAEAKEAEKTEKQKAKLSATPKQNLIKQAKKAEIADADTLKKAELVENLVAAKAVEGKSAIEPTGLPETTAKGGK